MHFTLATKSKCPVALHAAAANAHVIARFSYHIIIVRLYSLCSKFYYIEKFELKNII